MSFWRQSESALLSKTTPNSFQASFGGSQLVSIHDSPATNYTFYTFEVTASQNNAVAAFAASDEPAFLDLDDVSVTPLTTAVPEPSTWAMMLLGFAGVSFMGYRRSRKDQTVALAAA